MQASFWTIYKRSRFLSRALTDQQRIEQRERLGVACLALCLRHDKGFCHEFVNRICGVRSPQAHWRIDVDPYHEGWADILLQDRESKIVVECKIGDDLRPKQDPWRRDGAHFVAEKSGYGWYFHGRFPNSKRSYVVLTETRNDPETRRLDTICRAATWLQLRNLSKTNGKWVRDLYLSLANLDYPEFRIMKTKDIHVKDVNSVLSCHEVLTSVADRIGVSGYKIQHAAETEEEGGAIVGGYIGIEITGFKKSQRSRRKIKRAIGSASEYQAWFGYDLTNRSPHSPLANLSVWFYCSKRASKNLRRLVGSPPGWKIIPPARGTKETEKYFLHFSKPGQLVTSDVDDFLSILRRVIPEIGTK